MKDVSDVCRAVGSENAAQVITRAVRPINLPNINGSSRGAGEPHPLPPIKSVRDLCQTLYAAPQEVIAGLLHKGSKMVLGGGSKSYKTYCLTDLAISVAHGINWWGMETTMGKVLYVNFEIQEAFFRQRLDAVSNAKSVCLNVSDNLDVWTLRGYCADLSALMPRIIEKTKERSYDLIIVDPIYKGMGGRDENSAGDINSMLNEIEKLAVQSGAAVVFGAHFSKGNQAGKDPMDRISGSGVFARDPDSVVVMTMHENELTYTIEARLRNFKPIDPFCLRWEYPLMVRDDNADPCDLKRPGNRTTKYSQEQVLDALGNDAMTTKEWQIRLHQLYGMSERTFLNKKRELVGSGQVIKAERNTWKANKPAIDSTENAANGGAEVQ